MGILSKIAEKVLPYTVGDGKPAYRTNSQTGQRYTRDQIGAFAQQTSKQYNINYQTNPYIEPDKPALAYA